MNNETSERECSKCFRKGIDTMSCPILDCQFKYKYSSKAMNDRYDKLLQKVNDSKKVIIAWMPPDKVETVSSESFNELKNQLNEFINSPHIFEHPFIGTVQCLPRKLKWYQRIINYFKNLTNKYEN